MLRLGLSALVSRKHYISDSRISQRGIKIKSTVNQMMRVHPFAEGLAMGVAFCGRGVVQTGAFISASMAVHNISEGVTIS
jgi:zinc transporter ZupT